MTNDPTDSDNLQVEIYTDGACRGNPGIGGWGVLLRYGSNEKTLKGAASDTTNNRMEFMAAIEGLGALKKGSAVTLWTDSKYVKDGITTWIVNWKKKSWRTAANKPVKNADLWKRLDELAAAHEVDWQWVKGHAGNPGNEAADRLANEAIDDVLAAQHG